MSLESPSPSSAQLWPSWRVKGSRAMMSVLWSSRMLGISISCPRVRPLPERALTDKLASETCFTLVSPYLGQGPDLLDPRPLLRIIPGKLHGEPHVVDTRIPT